jgi:hypothetical protein
VRGEVHPRTRDRLRWLLVKFSIVGLTGIFVCVLAAFAAFLALILKIDAGGHGPGFLGLWRDEAMALLGMNVQAGVANSGSGFRQAVEIVQGLLALILPALYIGAVVFRLFIHPKIFVFRRKVALTPSPSTFRGELDDDGHVLAVRVYNASRMRALDVRFTAVHQHWIGSGKQSVVRNIPVGVANPNWPMADCHVPYTFFVPLRAGDVADHENVLNLERIEGRLITARDRLVVHVSGSMPEVGETFVERHAFALPEAITDEAFGLVHLEYGKDSKSWGGWDGFDP